MAIPEPKCVQWKRRGQRVIREQLAGATIEEELAYWGKLHQKLMRTRAASKKRLQAAGDLPAKREVAPMPEPKCVQWKREWQRDAREKTAGDACAKESAKESG